MERKAPPPRGLGGPPGVEQPTARRSGPPSAFAASPPPFGFPTPVNTSNRRNWRPGRVGGRHDSPLYGKHRKHPSSSSIDSNVSWSGSEIESTAAHSEQDQSRLSWASSVAREEAPPAAQQDLTSAASLFGAPAVEKPRAELELKLEASVQPPKTPMGKPTQEHDGEISAAQKERMGLLSAPAGSRAGERANSSENVFVNEPPVVYDEEKNGPQSCPSTFNNERQPQFSIDKLRQMRSNELVASKLLPTRASVNSLMGYVRELQISEASLRKQLVKTKQHTEEELTHSLSKVSELERSMQQVERDRELARQKMEEQEQLICDLAAKLKQAEAKTKASSASAVDELPPIAEEQMETNTKVKTNENQEPDASVPPMLPPTQLEQPPAPPIHPKKAKAIKRSGQFGLGSPQTPNQPLWDPWASGGITPMKNLPPVFNIGSTGLDPVVASSTTAQTTITDSTTIATEDYELRSVLMSPRREQENGGLAQQFEQNESAVPALVDFAPQYPAPAFNVGAMPSASYPQQQDFASSETHNVNYGVQNQDAVPLMESPSQAVPMLSVEPTLSAEERAYEQQVVRTGDVAHANGMEWSELQGQQEVQAPAVSYPPQMAANTESNEAIAPPPSTISAEGPAVLLPPPPVPIEDAPPQYVVPPYNGSAPNTHSQQVINPEADGTSDNVGRATSSLMPPPPSTPEAQPTCPACPAKKDAKPASAEQVSLEALLVDFYTEVDKKQLKMAKVYGKRYAGREKWLFAELTKRYGVAKVAALKARIGSGSEKGASTTASSSSSGGAVVASVADNHAANTSKTSNHPKAGRQGHPRHPQFFHPPAPASNVDLSGGTSPAPPVLTIPPVNDASSSQAEGAGDPRSPSGNVLPGHAPRQRENIPAYSEAPPSFPPLQKASGDEGNNAAPAVVATDGPPVRSGPPPPIQREEPTRQFDQPSPPPPGGMEYNSMSPTGLRQRHNAPGVGAHIQKSTGAEGSAVTLEGLLKDLYKKHQPDRLKNAPIVAKQYAGKELELVGLLKGKYGALSVKRLEENLEVLERAHRARTGGKGAGKKRGCCVRTISLVFWLSVLLYFSLGAVFVSFVVLDAWECRAVESDEQELESSEECLPLKKEMEMFTYERMCDYVSQSHSDACFCLEWKARESALFTNYSGDDLLNLMRLVPFSPESFGDPWIATVKEQVPSQQFYDGYAKPVVDLSLDVGSFVWSSALELAGYDDVSEENSPVVSETVENETFDISSFNEESDSETLTGSQERAAEEKEEETNESFANEMNVGELVNQDTDTEAAAVVDSPEQTPVDEESENFVGEVEIEELDIATKGDALVMEVDEASVIPAEEEATTLSEKSYSASPEIENEEHATATLVELTEEALSIKDSDSIEVSESESADLTETESEVKEILFDDDSASTPVEVVESVVDEDDGSTSSEVDVAEVPGEDNSADVADDVSDNVEEEGTEMTVASTEEESVVDSEEVVEVEVRQEGLDLVYAEAGTDAGMAEEVQDSDVAEVPPSTLDEELELTLSSDDEVLAASTEAEEMDAVSSDLAAALEDDSESKVNAEEALATLNDAADAEMVESESDVHASSEEESTEEDGDEESASHGGEEVDASFEENTVSEESSYVEEEAESDPSATDSEVEALEAELEEVPVNTVTDEVEEVEVEEFEVDISSDADAEKETVSMAEDTEDEGYHTDALDEESITPEAKIELTFSSSDADVEDPLSEETAVNEGGVDNEEENNTGGEELSTDAEVERSLPGDADVTSNEEDVEVKAVDDEDDLVFVDEVESDIPESEVEDLVHVANEQALKQTEDAEIEALELEESAEEVVDAPVELETVEAKDDEAETESDELDASGNVDVVSPEDGVEEEAEVGDEVENSEVEADHSEDDLVGEFGDESVTAEVTEVSDDVDAITAEPAELDEHADETETVDASSTEGEGEAVVAVAEETIVAESEETSEDDDEEDVQAAAEEVTFDTVVAEGSMVAETEETLAADDETAPVADVGEILAPDEATNDVNDAEEALNADEPEVIENETTEHVTEPQRVTEEVPDSEDEEVESGGLVSAVNDVLARLVEPFEAAKTAMPEVAPEAERTVDEL